MSGHKVNTRAGHNKSGSVNNLEVEWMDVVLSRGTFVVLCCAIFYVAAIDNTVVTLTAHLSDHQFCASFSLSLATSCQHSLDLSTG